MTRIDDVYADIDSQLIKAWTNLGGSGIPDTLVLDDADFDVRDALCLANLATAAQLLPAYTEFIPGYFQFDDESVPIANSGAKGLRVTSAQLAADEISLSFGASGNFFDDIIFKGAGANKITDVYDYAAEAVGFNLGTKDKIYLVPVYCHSYKEENFDDHGGFYNFIQQLNSFHLFMPRVSLLAGVLPTEIDSKDLPNARVMRSTQEEFGGTFTNSEQPASAFESDSTLSISHVVPADVTREGFLVAVIKRGEQTFYVWKD
jgi:hypothetical protein